MTTSITLICRDAGCPNLRIGRSLYCRKHRDRILRASAKKAKKAAKKAAKKFAKKAARKVARKAAR
jgi:hypothetical protein